MKNLFKNITEEEKKHILSLHGSKKVEIFINEQIKSFNIPFDAKLNHPYGMMKSEEILIKKGNVIKQKKDGQWEITGVTVDKSGKLLETFIITYDCKTNEFSLQEDLMVEDTSSSKMLKMYFKTNICK